MRVPTKGRCERLGASGVVGGVLQVVRQAQRQVEHGAAVGDDLGPAADAGRTVPDVAVVLLGGEGQVLAGGQLVLWDQPVVALPVVGDEGPASQASRRPPRRRSLPPSRRRG